MTDFVTPIQTRQMVGDVKPTLSGPIVLRVVQLQSGRFSLERYSGRAESYRALDFFTDRAQAFEAARLRRTIDGNVLIICNACGGVLGYDAGLTCYECGIPVFEPGLRIEDAGRSTRLDLYKVAVIMAALVLVLVVALGRSGR